MIEPEIVRGVYLQWERHAKPIVCNTSGASTAMVDRIVDLPDINLQGVAEGFPSPNPRPPNRARDDGGPDNDPKRGQGNGGAGPSAGGLGDAGPSGAQGSGFGSSLAWQLVADMIGIMEDYGPEALGFESLPKQTISVEGDLGVML